MSDEIEQNTTQQAPMQQGEPSPYNKGFGISSSIKDGLSLYVVNFINLTVLFLLYQLTLYTITYFHSGTFAAVSPTLMEDGVVNYIITMLISTAVGSVFGIAAIFGAICSLNNRQVNISTMLTRSITVFPTAFPAQILASLLMIIGFLFLIVPGVMVALMLLPLAAVLAWEKTDIMASLDRSRELTNGFKWQLLGLILIIAVPVLIFVMLFGIENIEALQRAATTSAIIANIILTTIFSAAMSCIVAVIYMQLRTEKG